MDAIDSSDLVNQNKGWKDAVGLVGSNQETSAENCGVMKELATKKKSGWLFGFKRDRLERDQAKVEEKNREISEGLWEQFARTTTGHGFARMADKNEPLKFRIFWEVAILFLTAGLFTSVFIISYDALVVKELRREFIVQHNSSLNLPDIHICDTSLFNLTILKEMGFNNTHGSYIALALSPNLASHGFKQNSRKQQKLEIDYRRLMGNKTIQEVFEKAALKCEDIILGCTHNTIAYSSKPCCNRFFGNRRYVTDLATFCISTHNQPPLEELFVSQIYGFTVYLKTNPNSRFEFDPSIISSNVASRRGIIYAVSDRITTVNPAISTSGYYTTPGTWTSVSITLTRTDNTELANGVLSPYSCALESSNSHLSLVHSSYEAYSQRNCMFASARSVLEDHNNCSRFRFHQKGNFVPCEPKVMIDAYSFELAATIKEKNINCPQDCIFDDYHVTSSSTTLHLGGHDDMHVNEVHDDNIVHTAIHFFYPSFSFTVIKNHPQSIVKWLSEVGGNMSIFVGASFVTLLEFAVLIIRFVFFYMSQ